MDTQALERAKQDLMAQFGAWTNHNMRLGEGLYTVAAHPTPSEPKLRRMTQIVLDWCGGNLAGKRVLDLACLEGMYGLELALHGAEVVGIEGREANLAKARFVRDAYGLGDRVEFLCEDVRNLSRSRHGGFDVVLCLGIFYHLDAPEVFHFMDAIGEVCDRLAVVDTHVSFTAEVCHRHGDLDLWGCNYREHDPDTPPEERLKILWASLDNLNSFWMTRPALYNLMGAAGFSSIYECHSPFVAKFEEMRRAKINDRSTFIGLKGQPVQLRSSDLSHGQAAIPWPDGPT